MESVKRYSLGVIFHTGCLHSYEEVVLATDFDRVSAENQSLQQRLTVQDQRVDELEGLLRRAAAFPHDLMSPISLRRDINAALKPTAEAVSHE